MKSNVTHSLLIACLSMGAMIGSFFLAIRQRISFRYAAGWIALSVFGVLSGLLVPLVSPLAELLNLAPISLVAGAAILVLVAICVQLSMSISALQQQVRQLAEKIAFHELESRDSQGARDE